MVYVFLADGFEETEAVAPIDMLRRAGLEVITIKVGGKLKPVIDIRISNKVTSSHEIKMIADYQDIEVDIINKSKNPEKLDNFKELGCLRLNKLEMIVLPGGAAGVEKLYDSEIVKNIIDYCAANKIKIGAICAAPSILARMGHLKNIKAAAHPSFRHYLADGGAILEEKIKVVTDGIFTTAAGAGVSIEFGL